MSERIVLQKKPREQNEIFHTKKVQYHPGYSTWYPIARLAAQFYSCMKENSLTCQKDQSSLPGYGSIHDQTGTILAGDD